MMPSPHTTVEIQREPGVGQAQSDSSLQSLVHHRPGWCCRRRTPPAGLEAVAAFGLAGTPGARHDQPARPDCNPRTAVAAIGVAVVALLPAGLEAVAAFGLAGTPGSRHDQPCSILQSLVQPSLGAVLPSSHASVPSRIPLPQLVPPISDAAGASGRVITTLPTSRRVPGPTSGSGVLPSAPGFVTTTHCCSQRKRTRKQDECDSCQALVHTSASLLRFAFRRPQRNPTDHASANHCI